MHIKLKEKLNLTRVRKYKCEYELNNAFNNHFTQNTLQLL